MKFKSTSSDSRVRSLRLLLALACLLPLLALAAPPGWWTDRQVLDPNAAKNDFGSVNQGQLKNMAKKAYAELRNALPSEIWTTPEGQALAALVDSWNPAQPGNFDIINQGQLKAVAKKFYDVLILHGYTDAYPWTGATTAAANDALANLGQLKNLFSFDLTRDSDGDGIPDWQETKFNLNPFNGQTNLTLSPPPPPPPLLIGVPNDWQGWTRIGRSDDPGLYGSGSTSSSALYDVYANQFYLNAALGASSIPVGNQYVTGDPTGLFTYSPGAFTGEHRILGIGVQGLDGANVSGFTPTVKFALGDNTYSAASSVPGTDGRVSFSLYSHPGDFTVQFQPVQFGTSLIYRPSNITFRGDDSFVYTLPGGIGSGASYDFAFRAIPLTTSNSYQMFFDLDAMQSLYSDISLFQATFNRQNVLVAPGTNYNGQGIGTIGSTVTIALNGLSNNTVVFSVTDPGKTIPRVEILIPEFVRSSSDGYWRPTNKLISTNKLAVGTLENSFEQGNARPLLADWIEADPDRFYVRISDPSRSGMGPFRVRVWTTTAGIVGYDDDDRSTADSEVVELIEAGNSGVFTSKSMLLTSNDGDDQHVVDTVVDNAKNDRTRKIGIGGKLKIELLEHKPAATYNADIEAEVPVEKTVKIKVFVATINGVQVTPDADIDTDLKVLQENMAQVGVKIVRSDPVVKFNHADAGINLSNGLTVSIPNVQEAGPLFDWVSARRAGDEISYIYVNQINNLNGGLAFRQADFPGTPNYVGHVLMGQDVRGRYIVAHEILHILLNAEHSPPNIGSLDFPIDYSNIRKTWGPGPEDVGITGRKRISKRARGREINGILETQRDKIFTSPYAK
jgi:hypothetical protein